AGPLLSHPVVSTSTVTHWMNRIALLVATAPACSSSGDLPASAECTAEGDCASGLSCVPLATFSPDGGCSAGLKACSKTCTVDADCASLGAKFKCFAGCGGPSTCGQTP